MNSKYRIPNIPKSTPSQDMACIENIRQLQESWKPVSTYDFTAVEVNIYVLISKKNGSLNMPGVLNAVPNKATTKI